MKYMLTSQARIFIAPRGAGCGREYTYYTCMKLGGLDRQTGESTPIYCPDPARPGRFIQVATIKGAEAPWASSITGYKPLGSASTLAKLAAARCKFDLQIHFGSCNDLSNFSDYEMAIVLEDVEISDYSIDGLGALNGGEVQPVLETVNIKAANAYEVYDVELLRVATALLDNVGSQVVGVTYSPYACATEEGEICQNFYAFQLPRVYSGVGADDLIYILSSRDGGLTWERHQIAAVAQAGDTVRSSRIATVGDTIVLSIADLLNGLMPCTLFSVPISSLDETVVTVFTTSEFPDRITRLRRIGARIYAVTENGSILWLNAKTLVPTYLEDGTLYSNVWLDIHGLDYDNLIVGGSSGTLAHRRGGASFRTVPVVVNGNAVISDITAVVMKSNDEWLIGTNAGRLYCTTNAGISWTMVFDGDSPIAQLEFPTKNTGYMLIGWTPAALYRTSDGGNTWNALRAPLADINDFSIMRGFAVCPEDPSAFVVVGDYAGLDFVAAQTDNVAGLDGFILIGD